MRLRKEIKGTKIVKENKTTLCIGKHDNYYTEIPLHSTKQKTKILKPQKSNEFSKIGRYKINIRKSIVILYTNNEQVETKIKKHNTIYNCCKVN